MTPKLFLIIGGTILVILGILGTFSQASFFHPPYWINWFHFLFGIVVLSVGLKGTPAVQAKLTLFGAVVGTSIGLLGLLFGRYMAVRFNTPELADPSDHVAHLIVGLCAIWALRNRNPRNE